MATLVREPAGDFLFGSDTEEGPLASEREPFLIPESEPAEEEPEREGDDEKEPFLIPEREPGEDEPEREGDEEEGEDPFLFPEQEPAEDEPDAEPERSSD